MSALHLSTAHEIAARIRAREISATEVANAALDRARQRDPEVNAFTAITDRIALADAAAVDAALARGDDPGPLAGVPFAAKNLFDIEGLTTLAGSIIERDRAPAARDSYSVAAMRAAGGVCLGALNMDEYAYGFTTENTHYGPCRNPHDTARIAGGSSGGSGAAVAAGLVPLSLGTDTNGSIRVPSSLNGLFGIKPTYGRLSRRGSYPFVPSLDHVGPFARGVADLALAYDVMQGSDGGDPGQAPRAAEPIGEGWKHQAPLRVARLGGHFRAGGLPVAQLAADRVAQALGAGEELVLAEAAAARAAAFLITGAEGAQTHLPDLRTRAMEFEPLTRDRLLAGAMIPAQWLLHAQRIRAVFRARLAEVFTRFDILVAPATPSPATPIGQETLEADGAVVPLRPSFGMYTQPISFIGLPVLTVPLQRMEGALPIGVQLIAAPWREDLLFSAAARLEQAGICTSEVAQGFA